MVAHFAWVTTWVKSNLANLISVQHCVSTIVCVTAGLGITFCRLLSDFSPLDVTKMCFRTNNLYLRLAKVQPLDFIGLGSHFDLKPHLCDFLTRLRNKCYVINNIPVESIWTAAAIVIGLLNTNIWEVIHSAACFVSTTRNTFWCNFTLFESIESSSGHVIFWHPFVLRKGQIRLS